MSVISLVQDPRTSRGDAGALPRVELDLPAALSAVHTAGLQLVPDSRGGTVLDAGHPGVGPLLPFLGATGTWAWTADAGSVRAIRRTLRPAGTLLVDRRHRPEGPALVAGADLVVIGAGQVEEHADPTPSLLDLTAVPQWRVPPRLLAAPGGVAGFLLDLGEAPAALWPERVDAIVTAARRWAAADRDRRPLLLLRGARTVPTRQVVREVLARATAARVPVPVVRVDVTLTVLDVAVRTVVRVLGVARYGDTVVWDVTAFPGSTAAPLTVLRASPADAGTVTDVVLRHQGRLLSARVRGGPVVPGSALGAPGWTGPPRPPVVRGFGLAAVS